jgi:hypothetical protein
VFVLCLLSALGNVLSGVLVSGVLQASLYLDTVFTVAVAFAFGVWPGVLTGALFYPASNILYNLILHTGMNAFGAVNVFVLCTLSEILLVCFFRTKIRPGRPAVSGESFLRSLIGAAAQLLALAALDCLLISVVGGLIDFVLYNLFAAPRGSYPEDIFKLGLYRNNVSALTAAILSRIPINIVDRFIAIFGGYGISLLYRKAAGPVESQSSSAG